MKYFLFFETNITTKRHHEHFRVLAISISTRKQESIFFFHSTVSMTFILFHSLPELKIQNAKGWTVRKKMLSFQSKYGVTGEVMNSVVLFVNLPICGRENSRGTLTPICLGIPSSCLSTFQRDRVGFYTMFATVSQFLVSIPVQICQKLPPKKIHKGKKF